MSLNTLNALRLMDKILALVEASASINAKLNHVRGLSARMTAENREPSKEEWAELHRVLNVAEATIEERAAQAKDFLGAAHIGGKE